MSSQQMPEPREPAPACDSSEAQALPLMTRLSAAVRKLGTGGAMETLTTLHPCFVDGMRTLVHRRGLAQDEPGLFQRVKAFALKNGFRLLEDRRKRELACRDERRRMAPILMFAAGLMSSVAMAEDGSLTRNGEVVVPTIEIIGERATVDERPYRNVGGKRFVSRPYGEVERIMHVAAEVRARGAMKRVRTRGLQMPSEYTDTFIDRYDYTLPANCGGGQFSYYEGGDFAALGYHDGEGKVVLDVLAGGGPFSAPRLWGAYDQVLNSNVRMKLMFGDGLSDGMGVLMASYKIGLMPVMRGRTKDFYGDLYTRAVAQAEECTVPAQPILRSADTADTELVDDAS